MTNLCKIKIYISRLHDVLAKDFILRGQIEKNKMLGQFFLLLFYNKKDDYIIYASPQFYHYFINLRKNKRHIYTN